MDAQRVRVTVTVLPRDACHQVAEDPVTALVLEPRRVTNQWAQALADTPPDGQRLDVRL